jgi:hypothetical protein
VDTTGVDLLAPAVWVLAVFVSLVYLALVLFPASAAVSPLAVVVVMVVALVLGVFELVYAASFRRVVRQAVPGLLETYRVADRGLFVGSLWNLHRMLALTGDSAVISDAALARSVRRIRAIVYSSYLIFAVLLVGLVVSTARALVAAAT